MRNIKLEPLKKSIPYQDKGFTMIELIVTITVLAVVAAFTAPSLLGFVEDAKIRDCRSKIADIKRAYSEEAIDMGVNHPSSYENFNLVDSAIRKSGGKYSNGVTIPELSDEDREKTGIEKYKFYAGLCPQGGEYVISFIEDKEAVGTTSTKTKIVVACTYPGHTEEQVNVSLIGLHTLENAINDKNSKIYEFYHGKPASDGNPAVAAKTGHLDSTGKNYAPYVQELLASIGIDISSTSSWQIVKLNRQEANPNNLDEEWGYNIFWTEEKIDDFEIGADGFGPAVNVIKYNTGTKKYHYGTGKVKKHEMASTDKDYDFNIMDFSDTVWTEATDI